MRRGFFRGNDVNPEMVTTGCAQCGQSVRVHEDVARLGEPTCAECEAAR